MFLLHTTYIYTQFIKIRYEMQMRSFFARVKFFFFSFSFFLLFFAKAANSLGGFHRPRAEMSFHEKLSNSSRTYRCGIFRISFLPNYQSCFLREKSWLTATAAPRVFIRLKLHEPNLRGHIPITYP